MSLLSASQVESLLEPYLLQALPSEVLEALVVYLDLLLLWNRKMNLTSVRTPERIVQRHFGESLFLAQRMPTSSSVLDFGSGAGFPGVPLQIALPWLKVTLAESQSKKASFLREVVRRLQMPAQVWAARVEMLPTQRRFSAVTMRAVDDTDAMLPLAVSRIESGGCLAIFRPAGAGSIRSAGLEEVENTALPKSGGRLVLARKPLFHVEHF